MRSNPEQKRKEKKEKQEWCFSIVLRFIYLDFLSMYSFYFVVDVDLCMIFILM